MTDLFPKSSAVISDCRRYRYLRGNDSTLGWIMLNPSTADAEADDPTIRRCIGFSRDWGYGGLVVMNLFALRATNPKELKSAADPIGPKNDIHLNAIITHTSEVVAAWGANSAIGNRDKDVMRLLKNQGVAVFSLGLTGALFPKHPLYLSAQSICRPYVGR